MRPCIACRSVTHLELGWREAALCCGGPVTSYLHPSMHGWMENTRTAYIELVQGARHHAHRKDFEYGEYIDCNISNKVGRYTSRMCIGLYYISCGVKRTHKEGIQSRFRIVFGSKYARRRCLRIVWNPRSCSELSLTKEETHACSDVAWNKSQYYLSTKHRYRCNNRAAPQWLSKNTGD